MVQSFRDFALAVGAFDLGPNRNRRNVDLLLASLVSMTTFFFVLLTRSFIQFENDTQIF